MTAEQLEELLGKVTQGEWRLEDDSTCIWGDCSHDDASDRGMGYPIAASRISPSASWARGPHIVEGVANAALIALAPSLALRVIAAEKLVDAAKHVCRQYTEGANEIVAYIEGMGDLDAALTTYYEASK